MTAVYRVRQGLRALFAFARPIADDSAANWLTPAELALFVRLRPGERAHSLNVLSALLATDPALPRPLAAAALLHDIGKIRCPLHLAEKTIVVLVRALSRRTYDRLAAGSPTQRLNRPFVVYQQHPTWSGEYLTEVQTDPETIWLCAHHADDPDQWRDHPLYPLLVRLQAADDSQ